MLLGNALGCHQKHSRSFFIRGYQFPVCARCTGIYIGNIIAIICLIFSHLYISIYVLFMMIISMVLDGMVQIIKPSYESNNVRRLFTGLLFGIAMIYLIKYLILKF